MITVYWLWMKMVIFNSTLIIINCEVITLESIFTRPRTCSTHKIGLRLFRRICGYRMWKGAFYGIGQRWYRFYLGIWKVVIVFFK